MLKKWSALQVAVDIIKNIKLILELAVNDFKTRYASSDLGAIWNFIQPIVTVMIYVFVFQYGFKAVPVSNVPYVLWLVAGIIPWFFFNDSLNGATNSLLEYSYLVKKVVFKIDILPMVKIVSQLFIHVFFIFIGLFMYFINGQRFTIHIIQIVYYSACAIALSVAISYFTAAVVIFFRDLGQIVGIVLQFGMWLTPIMWDTSMLSPTLQEVMKLNPMYYVTNGYRDAFYNHAWFFDRPTQTLYFWGLTIVLYLIGTTVFKKLEKHFADVM